MSKGGNSPGVSKLAGVLRSMVSGAQDNGLMIDYGVIQSDKSLLTNSYPIAIPHSDYLVCRHLKSSIAQATTSRDAEHTHEVSVETTQPLKVGDRVLVAWVLNDAVVVDVILDAAEVL